MIKLFVAILSALTILISLLTYNKYDPSINNAVESVTLNYLGYFGASIADVAFQIFGNAAFATPAVIIWYGVCVAIKQRAQFACFMMIIVFMLAFSGSLSDPSTSEHNMESAKSFDGGLIGYVIGSYIPTLWSCAIFLVSCAIMVILLRKRKTQTNNTQSDTTSKTLQDIFVVNKKQPKTLTTSIKAKADKIKVKCSIPSTKILKESNNKNYVIDSDVVLNRIGLGLIGALENFGVKGKILKVSQGPVVTLYEFEPSPGTKSSKVIGLADDVARSLSALSTRISTMPGHTTLAIEIPNRNRMFFSIRELLESSEYKTSQATIPVILGKDLKGNVFIIDLAKAPHALVAGTTGSGKSVGINAIILSILYRYTPDECRFIMIDPKMLELSVYKDIPHLLTPVVTEANKAVIALKWAVKEMETRYKKMSAVGVRNITGYNNKIKDTIQTKDAIYRTAQVGFDSGTGEAIYEQVPIDLSYMPFIVIIVDEMADLMLVAGKDIEALIQRLAQMARAAGIHLIMATQRPSVDVITGVIKANFPTRISFKVTSKIDSRTIMGEMGAEQLLGMGDMLCSMSGAAPVRVHGPFVSDQEVEVVADFLRSQGSPEYEDVVTDQDDVDAKADKDFDGSSDDDLYKKAVEIVLSSKKPSISFVQRSLRIGYNRAAILIERMEKEGIISEPNHSGRRDIL